MDRKIFPYFFVVISVIMLTACNETKRPPAHDIAASPEELPVMTTENIRQLLSYSKESKGEIGDSIFLYDDSLVRYTYEKNYFQPFWSTKEQWKPYTDSFFYFLANAKLYGLFPEDYHFGLLDSIQKRVAGSNDIENSDKRDAALWSRADLLLTDAFLRVIKDVKVGRLPKDSVTLRSDSVLLNDFYLKHFNNLKQSGSVSRVVHELEPKHKGYQLLKEGVKRFLDSADNREFTVVPAPGKNNTQAFRKALQTRLYEGGFLTQDSLSADSLTLSQAIKRFQKRQNIAVDGKAGPATVRLLNTSDKEKFIRIAITMDRYKMLPEVMPERYVWVNLPGYYMKLMDGDSAKIVSKIICGKPITRTPLLTSAIYNMVTYPQWTIPTSIIVKEILPGMRKDSGYLAKKGYSLIDDNGNEVDPGTVDWKKYSKGLPYKVIQGSGDDNALGVLKFNFNNKYAVYLHDTNQRYLFAQSVRSLSHGCVRVQEWQKLANQIIRYEDSDSLKTAVKLDSLDSWLKRKVKKTMAIKNKLPVYIRYFTCEGSENGIIFYDDVYGEDKLMREKYFARK